MGESTDMGGYSKSVYGIYEAAFYKGDWDYKQDPDASLIRALDNVDGSGMLPERDIVSMVKLEHGLLVLFKRDKI